MGASWLRAELAAAGRAGRKFGLGAASMDAASDNALSGTASDGAASERAASCGAASKGPASAGDMGVCGAHAPPSNHSPSSPQRPQLFMRVERSGSCKSPPFMGSLTHLAGILPGV